jgi:hypothetical protein
MTRTSIRRNTAIRPIVRNQPHTGTFMGTTFRSPRSATGGLSRPVAPGDRTDGTGSSGEPLRDDEPVAAGILPSENA